MISCCICNFIYFLWLYEIPLCVYILDSLPIHLSMSTSARSVFRLLSIVQHCVRNQDHLGISPGVVTGSLILSQILHFYSPPCRAYGICVCVCTRKGKMEGRAEYQANEKMEILSFSLEDNRILCDMKSEGRVWGRLLWETESENAIMKCMTLYANKK